MKLWVGNLQLNVSESEVETKVKALFMPYGATRFEMITTASRFCFVTISDDNEAKKAMQELNGIELFGRPIRIGPAKSGGRQPKDRKGGPSPAGPGKTGQYKKNAASKKKSNPPKNRYPWPKGDFPYRFAERPADFDREKPRPHNQLAPKRWDVAFDIVWETCNPTAANPCVVPGDTCFPKVPGKGTGYSGYNRRWLTVGDRLALSPFTVKSAIANAFANLMGACYRVNTSIERHTDNISGTSPSDDDTGGKFPYGGAYKRYRVNMDGSSKPGIVTKLTDKGDGSKEIEIQPVNEFLKMDDHLPTTILPNRDINDPEDAFFAVVENHPKNIHKPMRVTAVSDKREELPHGRIKKLKYHGKYRFGMNAGLTSPHLNKKYSHRFYQTSGPLVRGRLSAENFKSALEQMNLVYMGSLRKEGPGQYNDPRNEGDIWYQDLRELKVGDWVYFEEFDGQVGAIGLNFLFKTLFHHEDTIPESQKTCDHLSELCPRCRLFGLTVDESEETFNTQGYGGRFKSTTLFCLDHKIGSKGTISQTVPFFKPNGNGGQHVEKVEVSQWLDGNERLLCRQYLMPISGSPKPNKRDAGAYFNKSSGMLNGPKSYKHGYAHLKKLQREDDDPVGISVDECIQWYNTRLKALNDQGTDFEYSHRLRSYAQVCREGITFQGTVGAENADEFEIAGLLMVLDHRVSGHGFKIGLGKSLGLGSVKGQILRIWFRSADCYDQWQCIELPVDGDSNQFTEHCSDISPEIAKAVQELNQADKLARRLNQLADSEKRCHKFSDPGRFYWNAFNNQP